jgi:hypothetical protein
VDLLAAKDRIEELEEELENAGLALFLQERLAKSDGERLSADANQLDEIMKREVARIVVELSAAVTG